MSKRTLHKHTFYTITAHENLHVGAGDTNVGTVDNTIQRDPAREAYPYINGSSLKGALREYAEYKSYDPKDAKSGNKLLRYVFGDKDNAGMCRFYGAKILSIPMRAGHRPYMMATTPDIAVELLEDLDLYGVNVDREIENALGKLSELTVENDTAYVKKAPGAVLLEDLIVQTKPNFPFAKLEKIFGGPLAVINGLAFNDLCDALPVVSRNSLENGVSSNLFYEEILPRKSRLGFFFSEPDKLLNANDAEEIRKKFDRFKEYLTNEPVQIGANASIGYGACIIEEKAHA